LPQSGMQYSQRGLEMQYASSPLIVRIICRTRAHRSPALPARSASRSRRRMGTGEQC